MTDADRLDSWKEIATYMHRDVKTVQRWEKREGMPIHRHLHDRMGSVYAFRSELDAWAQNRRLTQPDAAHVSGRVRAPRWTWFAGAAAVLVILAIPLLPRDEEAPDLVSARFQLLTDFPGIEQAAAISRDGTLAAFLSDRSGTMDVWLTRIGSGEFHNLTKGAAQDIVNSSVRTVDFTPDSTQVTFWARKLDATQKSETSVWAIPVPGGAPRLYLDGIAEFDWTDDGRLVYHTSGPGDPMFVRDAAPSATPKRIFTAPTGLHSHFPIWSPDGEFIYFVQGTVPDRMDIWRIRPGGGTPERITNHDAVVTYPVFLNRRTLAYAASDRDGSGPWLHTLDVEQRVPQRISVGIDRFTSLAASRDGRRLVATGASPKGTLSRLSIRPGTVATNADATPIPLTTGNGSSPRFGPGFLLYVSSRGTGDSIWKLEGGRVSELWNAPDTRVVGGPAIARDGRRIVFTVRGTDGRTLLSVANIDGTDARIVPTPLELQGAPVWAPHGNGVTIAARVNGVPQLFTVPLDGGPATPMVREHAVDPAWSHEGDVVLFSGADVGTTFPLKAATADGRAFRVPPMMLTRGARHVAFVAGQRAILVLRGDVGHKNLFVIDLDTGTETQVTRFEAGFNIRDFDISPDGREIVIEHVQEHSDIVLLELTPR